MTFEDEAIKNINRIGCVTKDRDINLNVEKWRDGWEEIQLMISVSDVNIIQNVRALGAHCHLVFWIGRNLAAIFYRKL